MGMSTHVVGFRAPDENYEKMKNAWNACEAAGIEIPNEVYDFFEGQDPNDIPGVEVNIRDAVSEYRGDMQEGFTIDVSKLPKDMRFVRVYNSW